MAIEIGYFLHMWDQEDSFRHVAGLPTDCWCEPIVSKQIVMVGNIPERKAFVIHQTFKKNSKNVSRRNKRNGNR